MKKILFISLVVILLMVTVVGCGDRELTPQEVDKAKQEEILDRGQTAEPAYMTNNFLSRKAINKWLERMDDPSKTWYVYEFSDMGSVLRYYISSTVPLSYGVGISNP